MLELCSRGNENSANYFEFVKPSNVLLATGNCPKIDLTRVIPLECPAGHNCCLI